MGRGSAFAVGVGYCAWDVGQGWGRAMSSCSTHCGTHAMGHTSTTIQHCSSSPATPNLVGLLDDVAPPKALNGSCTTPPHTCSSSNPAHLLGLLDDVADVGRAKHIKVLQTGEGIRAWGRLKQRGVQGAQNTSKSCGEGSTRWWAGDGQHSIATSSGGSGVCRKGTGCRQHKVQVQRCILCQLPALLSSAVQQAQQQPAVRATAEGRSPHLGGQLRGPRVEDLHNLRAVVVLQRENAGGWQVGRFAAREACSAPGPHFLKNRRLWLRLWLCCTPRGWPCSWVHPCSADGACCPVVSSVNKSVKVP